MGSYLRLLDEQCVCNLRGKTRGKGICMLCVCMFVCCVQVCARAGMFTGPRGVRLPPLGAQTVLPADVGVVDEAGDVAEELAEAHAAGVVHGVVEQGGAPQVRLFPQQHAVQAGQALFGGVGRFQAQLLPALGGGPRLQVVVYSSQVVRS